MLVPSPTSASPMYDRCGTLVPAPISDLDLDERPGLGALVQVRAGAQVAERADDRLIVDARLVQVGLEDRDAIADVGVDQRGEGADDAALADRRRALSWVNGSIVVSRPMTTPASMRVEAGSTIVTPSRMCASRIRRWATSCAYARSTRSSTPCVSRGRRSGARRRCGRPRGGREHVRQIQLALRVVRVEGPERGLEGFDLDA